MMNNRIKLIFLTILMTTAIVFLSGCTEEVTSFIEGINISGQEDKDNSKGKNEFFDENDGDSDTDDNEKKNDKDKKNGGESDGNGGSYVNAKTLSEGETISGKFNENNHSAWFKIEIKEDCLVKVDCVNESIETLNVTLLTNDGEGVLNRAYGGNQAIRPSAFLQAGTYYIHVNSDTDREIIPFTVRYMTEKPMYANDTKESMYTSPNVLAIGDTAEGHINYISEDGERNEVDWYKFTCDSEGETEVAVAVADDWECEIELYENDGSTRIDWAYGGDKKLVIKKILQPGDYYVRIDSDYSDAGSYQISVTK